MADMVSEMKAFYDHYIDSFNRGDGPGANACYAFPWNLMSQGKVFNMTSEDSGKEVFGDFYEQVQSRGWARTEIDAVDAYPAGDNCGLLHVLYRRLREDGSLIEAGKVAYMVERSNGRWRFVNVVDTFDGQNHLV